MGRVTRSGTINSPSIKTLMKKALERANGNKQHAKMPNTNIIRISVEGKRFLKESSSVHVIYDESPKKLKSCLTLRDVNGRLLKKCKKSKSVVFNLRRNKYRKIPARPKKRHINKSHR